MTNSAASSDEPALNLASIGLVMIGGAIGTGIRFVVTEFLPVSAVPLVTLMINVIGAFLLGVLVEGLARRGPDHGPRRLVRLGLGTGVLGGFTTYSALATQTVSLFSGHPGLSGGYALATVLIGAVASTAGISLARLLSGTGRVVER